MAIGKRVTAKDVAKLAGVSQSTVSMILNNSQYASFSEETVKRVLDACATLHYDSRVQKRASLANPKLLLMICPSFSNLHYIGLAEAIQTRAWEMGYYVIVNNTFRNVSAEGGLLQIAQSLPVAGVICPYHPGNFAALQRLGRSVPVVLIYDKDPSLEEMDLVELNSLKLGMIIAEHLVNLGHRRIAYITTPLDKEQTARRRRLEGMEAKLAEHGISSDNLIVCTAESEDVGPAAGMSEYETGYRVTRRMIGKYGVTALVGTNDMVSFGIMDALLEQKLRIPQDYSVCGCDNTMPSRFKGISLTSVEHFSAQKGREAVDILVRKIESGSVSLSDDNPVSIIRVEYTPKLIARNSTGINKRKKG